MRRAGSEDRYRSYWLMEEWTPDEHTGVLRQVAEYSTHHRTCIEYVYPPFQRNIRNLASCCNDLEHEMCR